MFIFICIYVVYDDIDDDRWGLSSVMFCMRDLLFRMCRL